MIKNIIFDIGSVIFQSDINKMVKEYTTDYEEQEFIIENIYKSPEWTKYGLIDTGYISLETAILLIQDRTNHERDELVRDFLTNYPDLGFVSSKVISLIHALKDNGYSVYVLSNISESFFKKIDFSDLLNYIDGYILSYQVHQIKPYKGIYNTLLAKYDLNPLECLFIDDKEENLKTANTLGIKGENVIPNNFESIVDLLKKYNIME